MATATLSGRRVSLRERVSVTASRVDRDAGIIRGVKIIGRESKNGRTYTDEALRKAVGMYEGVKVHLDHPDGRSSGDRPVSSLFGYLRGVRVQRDGLYGDLHYSKSHPQAGHVAEMAEAMPHILGLSHNAEGQIVRRNGREVVEEIVVVHSVDLVCNPATTSGLFEGKQVSALERTGRILAAKGYTFQDLLSDKVPGHVRWQIHKADRESERWAASPTSRALMKLTEMVNNLPSRVRQVFREANPKPAMGDLERGRWTGSDEEWKMIGELFNAVKTFKAEAKDLSDFTHRVYTLFKTVNMPALNVTAMHDRMRDALPESRRTALPDNGTIRRRLGYFKTAEGGEGGEKLPDRGTIRRLLG